MTVPPPDVRPRALLLDDDRTFRFFVRSALEELGLDVTECETVAAATAALAQGPYRLVITDLLLREASGLELLRTLQQRPSEADTCHVVVLSGALDEPTCRRLADYQVWRLLAKPVSLDELQDCAREALALAPPPRPADAGLWVDDTGLTADERHAVLRHFAGDRTLFDAFRRTCRAQFPDDLQAGDAAFAARDAVPLQHLNHSLKTVLSMIGQPALASLAVGLDEACRDGDWPRIEQLWARLSTGLRRSAAAADLPASHPLSHSGR